MHAPLKTFVMLTLSLALSAPAVARTPVPIINHSQVAWSRSAGTPLDLASIRDRIIAACTSAGWSAAPGDAPDTLVATLVVRNKHTIRTIIAYRTEAFDVTYHDSENMNYAVKEPDPYAVSMSAGAVQVRTEVIHPHYNRWVGNLVGAIRARLAQ